MDNKEALTLTPKRLFSPLGGKWINLDCEPLSTYKEIEKIYYEQMGYAITATSIWIRLKGHFPCRGISSMRSENTAIGFSCTCGSSKATAVRFFQDWPCTDQDNILSPAALPAENIHRSPFSFFLCILPAYHIMRHFFRFI